jgi:hypothetical protein
MQRGVKRSVRDKTESATDGQLVIVCTGPTGQKREPLFEESRGWINDARASLQRHNDKRKLP